MEKSRDDCCFFAEADFPMSQPGDAPLQPGDALGPFRLDRLLGRGAFAETWRGERPGIVEVPVAIKVLFDQSTIQALAAEASFLLRLAHPHIVPVIEADEYEGPGRSYFAMVMLYEAGGDLRRRLIGGRALDLAEAVHLMSGVVDAVRFAHECKVLHRDIKPDNVFLRGGAAILGDFGLAAEVELRSSVDGQAGTLPYMAPEV
ncbi:hypothetical protein BH23PLA1_BH23PLA1_27460 [soil metagenome]